MKNPLTKPITIFNVQRFSLHDGPGIRTTVFLKGCSLQCSWCHNPESWSPHKQVMFHKETCIHCNSCLVACPQKTGEKMPILSERPSIRIPTTCENCLACVEACPNNSLEITGKETTAEDLFSLIERDRSFYKESGGGVTFSGGEPLLQSEALLPVLEKCKETNISVAFETAGNVSYSHFQEVLPYTDLFLYDMKAADIALHKKGTGSSNELIMENLIKSYNEPNRPNILIRIPLIPQFNDEDELHRIKALIETICPQCLMETLPYHETGIHKYEALGKHYPWAKTNS